MIEVAIVDDEDRCTSEMRGYFLRYGKERGVAFRIDVYKSGGELIAKYSQQYDIIMMDIDMPELSGLETAKRVRRIDSRVALIFVTNLAGFAIKGYEVDALDFMVKPVPYQTFAVKINKALSRINVNDEPFLTVRQKTGLIKALLSDIYYITVAGRFTVLHTKSGDVDCRMSMKELEKILTPYHFVRNDNSSMVNLLHVTSVNSDTVTVNGELIPVSRNRKKAVVDAFTLYLH